MTAAIKKRLHGRFNLVSGKEKRNISSRKDKPWTPIGDINIAYTVFVLKWPQLVHVLSPTE
jgi:hypothetical protein